MRTLERQEWYVSGTTESSESWSGWRWSAIRSASRPELDYLHFGYLLETNFVPNPRENKTALQNLLYYARVTEYARSGHIFDSETQSLSSQE